ncbi:hypothetical protein ACFO7V_03175 [Glutamicibacter bergerei]|uniref:TrbL/VirB6 plasmid conjugal transfer protein n=1 Tax=Glutamicibacter bergerei TaxID=256702 RepID=A0ABV9MH41_9MICC|nr:hypothetical protein [Micrococcaceae bacterium]
MANAAKCSPLDFGCKFGEGLHDLADGAIKDFVKSLYDGAMAFVAQVSTFWIDTPTPDVSNTAVTSLREDMSWYVAAFAVLGFLLGLIKLVMSQDVKNSLIGLATPIVNLILATTAYATGIGLLLTASDQFSKWIIEQSVDGEINLSEMLVPSAALISSPGPAFLLFILLLLGAIINLLFMYFRDVMFLILAAFIVALAAASGSEQGRQAWRKANGWLVALLLFKPVAAGIYSLGFRMLVPRSTEGQEASLADAMHSTLIALLILLLAALALPALIKFIVPAAGVGAGAFSGGAALGAGVTLAAGAAVLAGTGGAAAAGSGAAAALPNGSTTAASTATGNGAETAATSGSTPSGGEASTAASGGSTGGGSGASETISGGSSSPGTSSGDSGSSSSAPAGGGSDSSGSSSSASSSGETPSGSESSSSSGTGSSPSSGSGDSSAPASGGNTQSGATSNESANSSQSSESSPEGSSDGQETPHGGPSGAKPANKVTEAMQKMGDVKGLAQGANPSKLVDEDGE